MSKIPYTPGEVGFPPGAPRKESYDAHREKLVGKESVRGSVLNEANSIVNGARASVYGGPEDNFQRIAKLWGAHLNTEISTTDVAILLALVKVARLKNSPDHRDSWVDIAGYAACGAECGLK